MRSGSPKDSGFSREACTTLKIVALHAMASAIVPIEMVAKAGFLTQSSGGMTDVGEQTVEQARSAASVISIHPPAPGKRPVRSQLEGDGEYLAP